MVAYPLQGKNISTIIFIGKILYYISIFYRLMQEQLAIIITAAILLAAIVGVAAYTINAANAQAPAPGGTPPAPAPGGNATNATKGNATNATAGGNATD
jgi:hypothetical protein